MPSGRWTLDGCVRYICHHVRKRIEVSFNRIADFFAKRIYAITARGIELKAFLAVLAFSIDCITHVESVESEVAD